MWALAQSIQVFPWSPYVNLFIFVYNVSDIKPGFYALIRNSSEMDALKQSMEQKSEWENMGGPPLYMLREAPPEEVGKLSYESSCHQDIASDKTVAFTVMIVGYTFILDAHNSASGPGPCRNSTMMVVRVPMSMVLPLCNGDSKRHRSPVQSRTCFWSPICPKRRI